MTAPISTRPSSPQRVARSTHTPREPQVPTPASPEGQPSAFGEVLRSALGSIGRGERFAASALRPGRGPSDPGQLLALQAGVYRYTQEVELASKLVDKAAGGLKQVLQSQQ